MTGRFIILIDRSEDTVFAIVDGSEGREDCFAIFPTYEAAQACAHDNLACEAWGYDIIDLDAIL